MPALSSRRPHAKLFHKTASDPEQKLGAVDGNDGRTRENKNTNIGWAEHGRGSGLWTFSKPIDFPPPRNAPCQERRKARSPPSWLASLSVFSFLFSPRLAFSLPDPSPRLHIDLGGPAVYNFWTSIQQEEFKSEEAWPDLTSQLTVLLPSEGVVGGGGTPASAFLPPLFYIPRLNGSLFPSSRLPGGSSP